jgi:hypothetical protein
LRKTVEDQAICIVREPRIGVEEQQHVATRHAHPGIHLVRAPARGLDHAVSPWLRQLGRAVVAAAVDDDHLVPARTQRLQAREGRFDVRRSFSVGMMIEILNTNF